MNYSKQDCIEEIIALSENNNIKRETFRDNSLIPESTWRSYFGNWSEFKRAADLLPSRHKAELDRHIAKHASKDLMRSFNEEKSSWQENYIRPSGKRFQTVLMGSDIHDINCCPFWLRLFLDTADRIQPERIVINGDLFDLPEFSKYDVDPREYDIIQRIKWVHTFLEGLRNFAPNSQIDLVEGNHEFRLIRHLSESSPQLRIILSDLHGMSIKDLLGLQKFNLNFYAKADLGAFNKVDIDKEIAKNYVIINDQLIFHHFPEGKDFGLPGAHGHHHKHEVDSMYSHLFGSYEWHQAGCGHKRHASYTNGEKWSNGFLLAHMDTIKKRTQFEYIDTTNDHCFIGGKLYNRTEEELKTLI